jgi:phosphoketolase
MAELDGSINKSVAYTREHLQDPPEIRDWTWTRS